MAIFDTRPCALDLRRANQIVDHIQRKWNLEACARCGGDSFEVFAQVTLRFYAQTNVIFGGDGASRPTAAIVCTGCGHVLFLDLVAIGVFPPAAVPDETPPSDGPYR